MLLDSGWTLVNDSSNVKAYPNLTRVCLAKECKRATQWYQRQNRSAQTRQDGHHSKRSHIHNAIGV